MKILHVVNISFVIPYYLGKQLDYFSEKGYEIHIACAPSEHFFEYAAEKNFKPFPVSILREINVIKDVKAVYQLHRYIKKNKIEVVIGHTPKGALVAMISSYLADVRARIYFRHGIMFETSGGFKRRVLKGIERFTGLLATKVVCVSDSVLKASNHNNLSRPSKNIILGHGTCNGIDIQRFKIGYDLEQVNLLAEKLKIHESDYVVGYVGRLVKDKGITELIQAWKILLARCLYIKLLLVGPFEDRDKLPDEIVRFIKEEPSIIHTDLVDDTVPYYQLMNVFILPSYREGFPTVVLEASAMELPVITTRSTGCRDSIIENVTGTFTSFQPSDMACKISMYINNPALGLQHGKNGREYVKNNFSQEYIWREIEDKIFLQLSKKAKQKV